MSVVKKVQLVLPDQLERKVTKVTKVIEEIKAIRAIKVTLAQRVRPVRKENRA